LIDHYVKKNKKTKMAMPLNLNCIFLIIIIRFKVLNIEIIVFLEFLYIFFINFDNISKILSTNIFINSVVSIISLFYMHNYFIDNWLLRHN
jgi:hypothetical protein